MHSFRTSTSLFLTTVLAAAQTPSPPPSDHKHEHPVHLESFIVTASPYARQQADLAQPTSVLAGRELLLNQSSSLGELLSSQPGVSSTYFGPGASRPVIRGLGGDRIRMLTDGVGTIDASSVSPDHAVSIDPLLIERVEVVRGPATLLYGGSAVGGVVNVIDHRIHSTRPTDPFNARIEARTSSVNDEKSGGAVIEGGTGALAWHVDMYRRIAGNVEIPGFTEREDRRAEEAAEAAKHGETPPDEITGYIPNTSLTTRGGAFGFSLIGQPGYVGFAYSGHETNYGVPSGAHHHSEHEENGGPEIEENETEAPVRIHLRQRRVDFQGALTRPFGVFSEARFKFGRAHYRHTEFEGEEIGTVYRNRGFDGRAELSHQRVGAFTGVIGWQGGRSDFESIGAEAFLPPSRTTTQAIFLFEEADFKPFTWQLGARGERQAINLRNVTAMGHDETTLSASSGVVWTINETWILGASLAHAERAPNAQELFANGPHLGTNAFELGDADLDQERSLALDLTLRKRVGFVTGSATLFANRFAGFIFEQPTGLLAVEHEGDFEFVPPDDEEAAHGGLPVFQFVQRDADFHGVELETIFHLHHTDRQQLDLIVGADVVRARNTTDDTHLPRITPARLKTGLAWTNGSWALGGEMQFVARQNRLAAGETPSLGYQLISAYATYRFTFKRALLDLYVRGTNLGDDEARMHTSFLKEVAPLPGRNITLGIRTTF